MARNRSLWVDANNDPDPAQMKKHDMTDAYLDVRDPRVNLTYLNGLKAKGFNPGLYLCSQGDGWPNAHLTTPAGWAQWAYDEVRRIAPGTSGSFPKVLLNCETHDVAWIVAMLKRWRSHSPRRETYWSPEGRQAGIFSPAQVVSINETAVGVVPQLYGGAMDAHPEGTVILPMLRAGFNPHRLTGFYDAASLPWDWAGFAFSQGRLP